MSLINVFLSPSKALIGVDTEGADLRTGKFIRVSKMIHLPHANVVLAIRGTPGFLMILYSGICAADIQGRTTGTFDSYVATMPETFNAAYKAMEENMPTGDQQRIMFEQEVVMVGWSESANRMKAAFYKRGKGSTFESMEVEDPGYMAPWNDAWGEPPEEDGHRGMAKLAMAQVQNVKRESPQTAMGGQLMIAELTRAGMIFSQAHELPAVPKQSGWVTFEPGEAARAGEDPEIAEKLRKIGVAGVIFS